MNDIVVGLGFGDEGKGTTVDFLSRGENPTNAVVRFSGGPQTAHNVITPDGRHHTFAQFGSGTFHGVPTLLSRFMLVNPINMVVEADHLASLTGRDPFEITLISENAKLVTPIHRAANRQREINRGINAHGSCGQGIGETMAFAVEYPFDAPTVGELLHPNVLAWKLDQYRAHVERELGVLDAPSTESIIQDYVTLLEQRPMNIVPDEVILQKMTEGYNVFEGSQGVLLDEWLGFHPHTTWSTTTSQNAQTLLAEAGLKRGRVIGVTRTYSTRHGYGPFPSEFASGWESMYPEAHNGTGRFQGAWRAGLLDLHLLRYAVQANKGIDMLSVTHCDLPVEHVVDSYDALDSFTPSFAQDLDHQESLTRALMQIHGKGRVVDVNSSSLLDLISDNAQAPVGITSYGPTYEDKRTP